MINCKVKKTISGRVSRKYTSDKTRNKYKSQNYKHSSNSYDNYFTFISKSFHNFTPSALNGLVQSPGRDSLLNSNSLQSFWHDSFFLGHSLLTSLGSALFPNHFFSFLQKTVTGVTFCNFKTWVRDTPTI